LKNHKCKSIKQGGLPDAILKAMADGRWRDAQDLSEILGKPVNRLSGELWSLHQRKLLERADCVSLPNHKYYRAPVVLNAALAQLVKETLK
jgi:hypothetical protein